MKNETKDKLLLKIQEITTRQISLNEYYQRESNQIKSDIEDIKNLIERLDLDEEAGYVTAAEEVPVVATVAPSNIARVDSSEDGSNYELELSKGAVVRIINNYKGEYGTIGIVKRYTQSWVWLEDFHGNPHKRAPDNIEVIANNVEQHRRNRARKSRKVKWPGVSRFTKGLQNKKL